MPSRNVADGKHTIEQEQLDTIQQELECPLEMARAVSPDVEFFGEDENASNTPNRYWKSTYSYMLIGSIETFSVRERTGFNVNAPPKD